MKIQNKTLLITGGTGSFGTAVLNRFLSTDHFSEIRIFSRDEKKQDDMRNQYKNDKIKYYIGDVRDYNSVEPATRGVDYVFHAAALKQVPSCEFFPMQAVKTNVEGTQNVIRAAAANGVKKIICLSTDKAAYPINAMGISKAMMEKVAVAEARNLAIKFKKENPLPLLTLRCQGFLCRSTMLSIWYCLLLNMPTQEIYLSIKHRLEQLEIWLRHSWNSQEKMYP